MIPSIKLRRGIVTGVSSVGSRFCAVKWATTRGFLSGSHAASTQPFSLDTAFVQEYENRPSPFAFNGLGEVVFLRTYSRKIDDNSREQWFQTVERVCLLYSILTVKTCCTVNSDALSDACVPSLRW